MTGMWRNDDEKVLHSETSKREERTFFSEQSNASDVYEEDEHNMLNIGEFSPNNPKMRGSTQPFLGLGEYDNRRQMLNDQRKAEYQEYTEKVKRGEDEHHAFMKSNFRESRPVANGRSSNFEKSVQTEIKNVNSKLVHYPVPDHTDIEQQVSSSKGGSSVDGVDVQNDVEASTGYSKYMDRIGAVSNTSPRAKLMADLQSSCFPSAKGYGTASNVDDVRFEKVRKQEKYLAELRQQVEEKKMLKKKHIEDEKHEDDMESARVETQMRNLNFNKREGFGHGRHCYSSEMPASEFSTSINTQGYDNKSDYSYNRNKRMNENRLNSRATHYSNTSKYANSPPLLKRDKPPYSFNISPNSAFAHSVPVPVNKRNSKLVLNINNRDLIAMTTKDNIQSRLNYTNTTNKLEESLPIPVFKAQSPVAKELINALPVHSRTSDAMRKLEDKWQIPAVQKNILKTLERPVEGRHPNQGVLTQLGAIRLQLQQEQLRLDETLRKRGTSQSQHTIYANKYRNFN